MRALVCTLLFITLPACGGGDGATDLGPADTGVDAGSVDLGDVDADDPSSSLHMCNPIRDVATCPTGEHCSITDLAGVLTYGNCVLGPVAPIAEGDTCSRLPLAHHPDVRADACGDQHVCDHPNGSHPRVCYRLCGQTTDCAGTDLCQIIATDPGSGLVREGICTPDSTCDPLTATGCGTGENCIALRNGHSMTAFGTLCIDPPAVPVADGTMCASSNVCALGSVCANKRLADGGTDPTMPACQRYCDTTADPDAGAPHACPGGAPCIAYPTTSGLPPTLGLCVP